MKIADFDQAIANTPKIMPRFKLTRPAPWMKKAGYKRGHYFLHLRNGIMIDEKGKNALKAAPEIFKFVGYFVVKVTLKARECQGIEYQGIEYYATEYTAKEQVQHLFLLTLPMPNDIL